MSLPQKPLKTRKCKSCGRSFAPISSMSKACSVPCALALVAKANARKEAKARREEAKATRAAKEKIKTRGEHMKELQTVFNQWIRLRDADEPCISCGRPPSWQGQWDAGHYRSRGSSPALRFDPDNVHKQCGPCNVHLSGNLIEYRVGLIERRGIRVVERLEGPQEPLKMTIADIVEAKAEYRARVRELKKQETEVNQMEVA